MKRSLCTCIFAVSLCVASVAFGQQQQQQPLLIGVMDTASVIQKHPIVADELSAIQQAVQKEVVELNKYKQAMQKKVEEIGTTYKRGSTEFEEQFRPIRDQVRAAELQLQDKQQRLSTDVTKMQYKVHRDIQAAIQNVCERRGILIVFTKLKTSAQGVSEELAELNDADRNLVFWNRPECDITADVLAVLAQTVGTPKTTGGALSNISGGLTPSGPNPNAQPQQQPAAPGLNR